MKNLTIKEALLKIIHSKKCVEDILNQNNDKIYLYAKKMTMADDAIELHLNSMDCIVVLNNNVASSVKSLVESYDLELDFEFVTVSQIRMNEKEGVLFSAGVIAQNKNNECLMIKRDDYAPSEKNCWQFPVGRCEELISINTAKNEISEEVTVLNPIDDSIVSVADSLMLNNDCYREVNFYVDSKLIVKNNNFAVIDKEFNTLEQFYLAELNDSGSFILKDNEYNRDVKYISLDQFKNNMINTVNLLDKKKDLFLGCFEDKSNKQENRNTIKSRRRNNRLI